jgi:hypothetical protein
MRMLVRGAMFGAPLRKDERNARLRPILAELAQSDVGAGLVAHGVRRYALANANASAPSHARPARPAAATDAMGFTPVAG